MKKLLAISVTLLLAVPVFARHIRGGEMYYKYLGPGLAPNSSRYNVTLKLYIDCTQTSPGQRENQEPFTIFTKSNNQLYGSVITANLTHEQRISYDPTSNPCIVNAPSDICYDLRFFEATVELPDDPDGYAISFQRCCRIAGIENLVPPSDFYGVTYSCEIPGTNLLPANQHNSSPQITGNDAVAICVGSFFNYNFSAVDPIDGDSLVYSLCNAYIGASSGSPAPPVSSPPPFSSVPYQFPYNGSNPLGLRASIDPATGIISGIAPLTSAQYVVTGCIHEYRNGVLINTHRKDIHLRIADCAPLRAVLRPDYSYCDDFLVTFRNEQTNPSGSIYVWNYGDGTKADTSVSTYGDVQHQYADSGTYKVKLKVILAGQCVDSTSTLAKVYPGFNPGFIVTGSCLLSPLQFTDTTKSRFGTVTSWRWNFGDETTLADTSHAQNPSWKYSTIGTKKVELIAQSNKGCLDTAYADVLVKDKPLITLGFKDTLICSNLPLQDTLQLHAGGLGLFSWTPGARIVNFNTPNPLVFPTNTTTYYVHLNENGCLNTDSVRVRVVDHVTLNAGPDTTICLTDSVTLRPVTNGLGYAWSPAATLNNATIKNPIATPKATTTYQLISRIGKCNVAANVTITTAPYPGAKAGPGQILCYGDSAQINATIVGSSFFWTPVYGLSNPFSLTPRASPPRTTPYILTVYDSTGGCPKPKRDTVVVIVRPPVIAFAGNDTTVVVNQLLRLTATGAQFYLWTPPTYLNRNDISSPTAVFTTSGIYTYAVKVYTPDNCFSTDTINIKVFNTSPDIFVPNAFTPGRNQNNIFRPIPVGISKIDYFRVYDRWGLLLFTTTESGRGWDGTYAGKNQDSGTYVWVVQGRDFTGKIIAKKGTVVLLR